MKKRTSNVSRRIVSLLMSMVLTLTLVTPAAFAEGIGAYANGEGTAVTTPADIATQEGEDTSVSVAQRTVTVKQYHANEAYEVKIVVGVEEGVEKLDTTYTIDADTKTVTLKLTTDGYDGEPVYIKTALDDVLVTEGENQTPALTKDTPELEYALPEDGDVTLYYGTQEDFNAPATQRTVTVEQYRANEAYDVKLVVGVEEDGTTEKLDTTYTINADTKTVTLKLTTADYAGEPVYIKTALDDVLVTEGENPTPALTKETLTLEYALPEDGDVTLYYGTQEDFVSAWYTSVTDDKYTIRTAEELANFAQLVNSNNSFSGKTLKLTADIDLGGNEWTPIGGSACPFRGTFDGNSFGITGLKVTNNSGNGFAGLFGDVQGSTIKNLTVSGTVTDNAGFSYSGGITGRAQDSVIDNCTSNINISDAMGSWIGGIAAIITGSTVVRNCVNTGNLDGVDCSIAGGIVGEINGSGKVQNSYSTGNVNVVMIETTAGDGSTYSEGIVGSGTAANCYYLGTVTGKTARAYYIDDTGAEKEITVTGEGANTKYTVGDTELVALLNEWANTHGATITLWKNSAVEPYNPVFKTDDEPDAPAAWDGTSTTEVEPNDEGIYEISTGAELAWFEAQVNDSNNSFSGKTLKLTADIDLGGNEWTPIGGSACPFRGTFDGNSFGITGLKVTNNSGNGFAGLFGDVQGSTIKNLTVSGTVTDNAGFSYSGGITGRAQDSVIDNCTSNINISDAMGSWIGGIAAIITGSTVVRNCVNTGNLDGVDCSIAGGIVGEINGSGKVQNSYSTGNVNVVMIETTAGDGSTYSEGIVGSGTAANCYYLGTVTGKTARAYYIDDTGAEKEITVTGEGANTKYTVGDTELVALLNEWANTHGATITLWKNSAVEPYNPIFMTGDKPAAEEITLVYDANRGEGSAYEKKKKGVDGSATFTIRDDAGFSYKGKKFNGWNTTTDGDGVVYTVGQDVTIRQDLTLYAMWKAPWDGSGTEADPYQIKTEADLIELRVQVNENGLTYAKEWFQLVNSISLTDEWTPIGNSDVVFMGNLDGNGLTISNLKITAGGTYTGLFGCAALGTFRNLNLTDVDITGTGLDCGSVVGYVPKGSINLMDITAAVNVKGKKHTGGLVGRGYVIAEGCTVSGSVSGDGMVGGLVAGSSGDTYGTFIDCVNRADVSSTATYGGRAAGIQACSEGNRLNSFTGCINSGTIIASGADSHAAGIANGAGKIENCQNSGAISAVSHACGIGNGVNIEKCSNTGFVNGGVAAGIATGYVLRISFCSNTGAIEATAGGVSAKRAYGIFAATNNIKCTIKYSFSYVAGKDIALAPNTLAKGKVTNSYYLASSATAVSSAGEYATLADFASGKVAWGVGGKGEGSQGGTDQDAKLGWWKQDKDDKYPTLLDNPDMSKRYYRTDVDCGTGGAVTLDSSLGYTSTKDADNAVYGPAGTSVTIKATPKDNTFGLKSLTWTHNGKTDVLPAKGTTNIVMPAESNVTIHAEFASVGPGGNGGYYYGGSGDGTGTGDKDDEGLQDGLNMDVEYDIKGLVLGAYAEWGSNGGNKSFQKWLEENPNVVRALLTNSLDNMATAAVGKKTDEAKDLAALLLASLNEHTGVDGKNGDTIAKALQKYIDSGSEEVFSAWLTGGGGMASGTYESIYGQYASSLAALADRLYSKWEASGTSMTFPVWLDSQQVTMESLSENAEEPDTEPDDTQTTEAPEDVPDGQDTEGGASGNSVWEVIGTVVRENPILVWSIVAVIAALIIVGAVRRYHKVKRDEHDEK